jgi:hypothetical protein
MAGLNILVRHVVRWSEHVLACQAEARGTDCFSLLALTLQPKLVPRRDPHDICWDANQANEVGNIAQLGFW